MRIPSFRKSTAAIGATVVAAIAIGSALLVQVDDAPRVDSSEEQSRRIALSARHTPFLALHSHVAVPASDTERFAQAVFPELAAREVSPEAMPPSPLSVTAGESTGEPFLLRTRGRAFEIRASGPRERLTREGSSFVAAEGHFFAAAGATRSEERELLTERFDEYRIVDADEGEARFEYVLTLPGASWQVHRADAYLELSPPNGPATLRVFAPIARDRDAHESVGTIELSGATAVDATHARIDGTELTLAMHVSLEDLEGDVVVDPGFGTTASMSTGRRGHGMVELTDGLVVAFGGETGTSAEIFDPGTGTWSATGSTSRTRIGGTSTMLEDGRILFVGGATPSETPLATAEIYDPDDGTWSGTTGNLTTARYFATSNRLSDGRVMIVGGLGASGTVLASVEIFDPETGAFTTADPLPAPRYFHASVRLDDGNVLVIGGADNYYVQNELSTAYLFDAQLETWSTVGSLVHGRSNHAATLLSDGTVLVTGGFAQANVMETYDPVGKSFSALTPQLTGNHSNHAQLALPSGKVVLFGGSYTSGAVESYDPATGDVASLPSLAGVGDDPAVLVLRTGRVLVAGGLYGSSASSGVRIFDPGDSTTGNVATLPGAQRVDHIAELLTNGLVLVAGGNTGAATLDDAALYDTGAHAWTATGSLKEARTGARSVRLPSGNILVSGGRDANGAPLTSCEVYDVDDGTFSFTGSHLEARAEHVVIALIDGTVLAIGGATNLKTTERYDESTGEWVPAASMSEGREQFAAAPTPMGQILAIGGYAGGAIASCELYDPYLDEWTPTGSLNQVRRWTAPAFLPDGRILASGGFGGGVERAEVEIYDPFVGSWTTIGSLPTAMSQARSTVLPGGLVLTAGGQTGFVGTAAVAIYDPATGVYTAATSLSRPRSGVSATLLPDGTVLYTGGSETTGVAKTSEVYDALAVLESRRPTIASPDFLVSGATMSATGTGFEGVGESSNGTTANTSNDHPVLAITRVDGTSDFFTASAFSPTSITFRSPWHGVGNSLFWVITQGVPQANWVTARHAPVAGDFEETTNEDEAKVLTLVGSDEDGDEIMYEIVSMPSHGTLVGVGPGESQTYTPAANFNGSDSFTYRVFDGTAYSDVATVDLVVASVNDAPVAVDTTVDLDQDTIDAVVALNATDVDLDSLSYSIVSGPSHGSVTGSGANRLYTPVASYVGSDDIGFTVTDGNGGAATATVHLVIHAVAATDAGVGEMDAGFDAGSMDVDAGSMDVDAGSMDVDAGSMEVDAGSMEVDAGSTVADAGSADAGSTGVDAGSTAPDAGSTVVDAGTAVPDASVDGGPTDAGPDASADGGSLSDADVALPEPADGGCSCSIGGARSDRNGSAAGILAALVLVVTATRRRLRARARSRAPD